MEKKIHFVSGLPRSGSTLLANILMQNPEFHVSPTSGVLDVMFLVRNSWNKIIEFQANPDDEARKRVIAGVLNSFYSNIEKKVIFDRSRSWVAHLEMAEMVLGRKAKVLVPVRDLRDVLASFEKLQRQTSATMQSPHEEQQYLDFQDMTNRVNFWGMKTQPVGLAYVRIKDAVARGFQDRMHFVPYEKLTAKPRETMEGIYDFLEIPYFKHNFSKVEQKIFEDDRVHGFTGLHKIREKVEPQEPQWPKILTEDLAKNFANLDFWNK